MTDAPPPVTETRREQIFPILDRADVGAAAVGEGAQVVAALQACLSRSAEPRA